jgi:hypothetical protein
MKHLLIVFCMIFSVMVSPAFAPTDDEFDYTGFTEDEELDTFDNYTIEISDDADIACRVANVSINSGDKPAAVQNFDIAGIMLGMTFEEAQMIARENGLYINRPKDSVVYSMHSDWKYSLDYECRRNGVYAPAKLEACINSLARNRGVMYAAELHLVRNVTGETIDVYFTSNATNNVVWKIVYKNDVDEVEGDAEKFANQRDKKIWAWWQNVLDKYGNPNSDTDKWVSSDNAFDPMMTAYYGELELVDCGRQAEDSAINIQSATDNFAAKSYAF